MSYVLDTSSFIICGHYFPSRFPTFWEHFDDLVDAEGIISVREVRNELDNRANRQHLRDWVDEHRENFLLPEPEETEFVSEIFAVPHFQHMIGHQQRLRGSPVADPFVIASARVRDRMVVTEESHRPNAARIPNVCVHFGIECISIEQLMEMEGWEF